MFRTKRAWAALAAAALVAGGCGSSGKSATGGSTNGKTYTVGILTDLTGPGSNTGSTTLQGIKAGIGLAAKQGYNIKYVTADTGTSLTQTLTAAKTLVQQDHVFAVIQISVVGFAAASYLTSAGIPVIGGDVDGPEWLTARNMFSIFGYADYTKVQTTLGQIFKQLGATTFGGLGYGIEPSSADNAKGAAVSAQLAGLKSGYLNAQLTLGSTDMGPVALAMKNAGVDAVYPAVTSQTSFALLNQLRQLGVNFKALLPTGYGGDLTGGGQGAAQAAQGVYFTDAYQPFELHTAATQRMANALKAYAGWTGDPTLSEYMGYTSIDALVKGLQAAGSKPTQPSFINTMLGITNYDAAGLWGGRTSSFALAGRGSVAGADNCDWITQYSGSTFRLVPHLDPICGQNVPGKTIS